MNRIKPRRHPWRAVGCCALGATLALLGVPRSAGADAQKLAYVPELPELHPNLARGNDTALRLESDAWSSINVFNGNLAITIPLGLRYPVSPRLAYQVNLSYNSQIWDFRQGVTGPIGVPVVASNAGLGFDVSFGRLLAPGSAENPTAFWLYLNRDGTPRRFYSDLHWDTPDVSDAGDVAKYTRDGSFLRLKAVTADEMRVEAPDGSFQAFTRSGSDWRISRLGVTHQDDDVTFTYAADGSAMTLTDAHGRVQTIHFRTDPTGRYPRLVDRIVLSAFNTQSATYTFGYSQSTITRACADVRGGTELVPLLASITDPTGVVRTFTYHGSAAGCLGAGRLEKMQLPAGGFLRWEYGSYDFPPFDCAGNTPTYFQAGSGVRAKEKVLPNGAVVGRWTYLPEIIDRASLPSACQWREMKHTLTTPLGDRWVRYFSVANGTQAGTSAANYALPVSPSQLASTGQGALAEEVFDCAPDGTVCELVRKRFESWEQNQTCASLTGTCWDTNRRLALERTVYLDDALPGGGERYVQTVSADYDGLGHYRNVTRSDNFGTLPTSLDVSGFNLKAGEYEPGGPNSSTFDPPAPTDPWVTNTFAHLETWQGSTLLRRSDYCHDASGAIVRSRLRRVQAAGSSDAVTQVEQISPGVMQETYYGGDVQSLAAQEDLCTLPLASPQYTIRREYEGGVLVRQFYANAAGQAIGGLNVDLDLDANTGLTAEKRDVAGIGMTFVYDLLGRVTTEQTAEGARRVHIYRAPTGGSTWADGWLESIYEYAAGSTSVSTTFLAWNDLLGNLAADQRHLPENKRSRQRFQYNAMGWRTHESNRFLSGTSAPVVWTQHFDFDPFGRVGRTVPPEGSQHEVTYEYRGNRETVVTRKTADQYFPPFGGTASCHEEPYTVATTFDRDGDVWRILEARPRPLPGSTRDTTRVYDAAGRLLSSQTTEQVLASSQTYRSEFSYDGRGWQLASAVLGPNNTLVERTELFDFDARGNHRTELRTGALVPGAGVRSSWVRDSAERLMEVRDALDPARVWKTFSYGSANVLGAGGAIVDARKGKLVAATRHNHWGATGVDDVRVEEAYQYAGKSGRQSGSTVTIRKVGSGTNQVLKSYTQSAVTDDFGRFVSQSYPQCVTCGTGEPVLPRTVTQTLVEGKIVALTGLLDGVAESWVTGVSYAAHLEPATVTHANGVVDTYETDAYVSSRPKRVRVTGTHVSFDSGELLYSGDGKTCGVGESSTVRAPNELSGVDIFSLPCSNAFAADPFGLMSGEVVVPACGELEAPPRTIYDAADRAVGYFDHRARERVLQGGNWYWVPDWDNFIHTWSLYGLDGSLLRRVEETADGNWRTTTDSLYGAGRRMGRTRRTYYPANVTFIRHAHPFGQEETNGSGQPRADFSSF